MGGGRGWAEKRMGGGRGRGDRVRQDDGCGLTTAAACAVPQEEEEVRQDKRTD